MRTRKEPRWKLDDDWGVDTDEFNWILYKRAILKDGSYGRWNARGYYPNEVQLFESLYQRLVRTEPKNNDLCKHVESISERVLATTAHLSEQLKADIWSGLKRPSRPT